MSTETRPTPADLVGQIVAGNFRILEKIGEGGMGVVYAAEQLSLGRKVALKVLHQRYTRDEEFAKRFRREARLAASLNHANIVTMYDFGQDTSGSDSHAGDERLFLAMEYVEGENLKTLLHTRTLSVHEAVHLGAEIAEGLDAAHRAGVIHRDIKPENIMVLKGGRSAVKLMDFGIANVIDIDQVTHLTSQGMLVGTPAYMAPERIETGQADERADIYAFGILLYEMLTGDVPFSGQTPAALLIKHLQAAPPPLREMQPSIPASVEALVLRILDKDPNKRPSSMGDIAQALRESEGALSGKATAQPSFTDQQPAFISGSLLSRKTDTIPSGRSTRETRSQNQRSVGGAALAITATFLLGTVLTVWIIQNPEGSPLSAVSQLLPGLSQTSSGKSTDTSPHKTTPQPTDVIQANVDTRASVSPAPIPFTSGEERPPIRVPADTANAAQDQSAPHPRAAPPDLLAPPAPPPTRPEPVPSVAQQLATLSSRAQQQENAQKLTTPSGDNAWETYQEILQLAPDDPAALAGQQRITQQYLRWAQAAEQQQAWAKARGYHQKILSIAPQDPTSLAAVDRLTAQQQASQLAKVSQAEEHIQVGKFHFKRGQYAEALAAFEQARALQPDNAEAVTLLERTQKAWDVERRLGVAESR